MVLFFFVQKKNPSEHVQMTISCQIDHVRVSPQYMYVCHNKSTMYTLMHYVYVPISYYVPIIYMYLYISIGIYWSNMYLECTFEEKTARSMGSLVIPSITGSSLRKAMGQEAELQLGERGEG